MTQRHLAIIRSSVTTAEPLPSGRIEVASADGSSGLVAISWWPPAARSRWN